MTTQASAPPSSYLHQRELRNVLTEYERRRQGGPVADDAVDFCCALVRDHCFAAHQRSLLHVCMTAAVNYFEVLRLRRTHEDVEPTYAPGRTPPRPRERRGHYRRA